MINEILPDVVDNNYKGNKIALWFFYLITAITVVRSCIHIFKHDGGAQSIATIPLDTYTNGGAEAVIFIFAYWGLSQLLFGILYVIVAMKYKSLIPLMYLSLLVEYGGRFIISLFKSLETVGQAPGGVANYIFPILCLIMFFLSINKK
ncbi:MAG: hypothetical protein NXI23_07070 [Bacteroidetes bacterium]|jgi:hypothetical protein|nr:hypothetical protein [Bacteroidota bacterium]MDF1866821.1 hypothetical protein [Saprospiraceae bacterium]